MNLESLQKKYPEFIYESCAWSVCGGDLLAEFSFVLGDILFHPNIAIHGIDEKRIESLGADAISGLIFNMGLAEMPSYWKAACSPVIIVKAGYMDSGQANFWQDTIANMGQFFYENGLPFIKPEFRFGFETSQKKYNPVGGKFADRYLVPMGGGKDSIVTLETLRGQNKETAAFTLNANANLRKVVAAAGAKNIFVERRIDPKLIELNNSGYLNGHTPFSSILSVAGVCLAAIFDFKYVAISQERSSNEGNIEYLGRDINHQYSKTFGFENKFREYSKKYLAKNIEYFSFLRPLYEIQISRIFSRYPKYFGVFLSCNKSFTIAARESGICGWCGKCSKCLSVYSMLYPFIGKEQAAKIFSNDLFENRGLLPVMSKLIGENGSKPMECVGTFAEMRTAFYLSLEASKGADAGNLPALLEIFKSKYLPKYGNMAKITREILSSWDKNNNLAKNLASALKDAAGRHAGDVVDNFV